MDGGLVEKRLLGFFHSTSQSLEHGGVAPSPQDRIGRAERLLKELVDGDGLGRLRSRLALRRSRPDQPQGGQHRSGENGQAGEAGGGDAHPMTPHELVDRVGAAGGSGPHRLVVQVAAQVQGQRVGRLVAPVAVLLQGLESDPVQVALELRGPDAGRLWVLLPDPAPHFVDAQGVRRRLERERSREELVEDDAQGVHVGAGVDVQVGHLRLLGAHVLRRAHNWPTSVCGPRSVSERVVALATPKSMIFGTGRPSRMATRTFEGLMSRWITPF